MHRCSSRSQQQQALTSVGHHSTEIVHNRFSTNLSLVCCPLRGISLDSSSRNRRQEASTAGAASTAVMWVRGSSPGLFSPLLFPLLLRLDLSGTLPIWKPSRLYTTAAAAANITSRAICCIRLKNDEIFLVVRVIIA